MVPRDLAVRWRPLRWGRALPRRLGGRVSLPLLLRLLLLLPRVRRRRRCRFHLLRRHLPPRRVPPGRRRARGRRRRRRGRPVRAGRPDRAGWGRARALGGLHLHLRARFESAAGLATRSAPASMLVSGPGGGLGLVRALGGGAGGRAGGNRTVGGTGRAMAPLDRWFCRRRAPTPSEIGKGGLVVVLPPPGASLWFSSATRRRARRRRQPPCGAGRGGPADRRGGARGRRPRAAVAGSVRARATPDRAEFALGPVAARGARSRGSRCSRTAGRDGGLGGSASAAAAVAPPSQARARRRLRFKLPDASQFFNPS